MSLVDLLLKELEMESQTTRKMLSRVPADKFTWKPHEKSMSMLSLATHIADLPTWVTLALTTDELDFASSPYQPEKNESTEQLVDYFERSLANGKSHLENADESTFNKKWVLRNGDTILSESTKYDVIRMTFSQIIHHRAQLGVYLRLLNVPIPGSYGPSADDQSF
jgi:uncharacterized damage-inducible protein DinB